MGSAFPRRVANEAQFQQAVEQAVIGDWRPSAPFLDPSKDIVVVGSCFAANIGDYLRELGYRVARVHSHDRFFTSYAIRSFFETLASNPDALNDQHLRIHRAENDIGTLVQALKNGASVIVTLGFSLVWRDKESSEMVDDPAIKDGKKLTWPRLDKYEFLQTSVEENVEACMDIINAVRRFSPGCHLIFTLSPIPINFATEYPVVMADCLSKATLRLALDHVMRFGFEGVHYFPSFELLKWFAPMFDTIWNAEDREFTHIKRKWIRYTLAKFCELYCVGAQGLPPPIERFPHQSD